MVKTVVGDCVVGACVVTIVVGATVVGGCVVKTVVGACVVGACVVTIVVGATVVGDRVVRAVVGACVAEAWFDHNQLENGKSPSSNCQTQAHKVRANVCFGLKNVSITFLIAHLNLSGQFSDSVYYAYSNEVQCIRESDSV